ncbi:DNA-binding domain-containing protein, AraC-type [Caulobacter sp. AP07]|uniref:helix-turn-helix transcriptional regulator n=1 Tax=Caulobacter sp. AP07 TaxID=1144304 RepID=UPI0002721FE4|nr:helix-turn-helix transcriptional regulator [Caulobacter sp. AP07]EJL36476.1 DNA-binding domain-containing protein, AraC-type [Caulobacter sp. AP07]
MTAPRTAFSQGRFYGVSTVERQLPSVRVAHLSATISAEGVEEHSHDDAHFVLATHGRYLTTAWGPETEGPPLVFNPPGVVHRDRFVGAGGHFLAVSFEAATWRDLAGQEPTAGDALRLTGTLARTCALRLTRAILTRDVEPVALESLGLELAAQVQTSIRESDHRPGWLAAAEAFLADAFDQPIAVADVARAAGVHPVHLARGYRRWFGATPGARLRTRRLERAADLLMLGRTPIGEIALRAGFCDQSHLNRQFRLAYGVTPGEFARLCGRRLDVASVQDGGAGAI